jgi:hypothetical protein
VANSRYYSSVATVTTLTGGITGSDITVPVASTAGFPGSLPFTLAIDYGAANEELVEVTGVASLSLTVTRAIDGTSASSHAVGAVVRHVSSARDFTDSRTHEAASTNVHGLSGGAAVVGTTSTQTLTNKTLTRALGSLQNITLFNVGAVGTTAIVGDSTNPSANRLDIKDNEVALNSVLLVQSNGGIKSVRDTGDTDNSFRIRVTDADGTTDRFYVTAAGAVEIKPNASTTFVGLDMVLPDTTNTKRAIRLAASGGGTERFTVFNDGRLSMVGTDNTQVQANVKAPAGQTVDIFRVQNSGGSTLFAVQNTGKVIANVGATVAQPGVTTGAVLQVGGSNVGYTGNLQQWVSPANAIVANITETGALTAPSLTATGTVQGATVTATGAMNVGTTITNSATGIRYRQSQNGSVSFVFSAVSSVDVNVTFPIAFAATPKVTAVLSSLPSNSSGLIIRTSAITSSGMTLRCNDVAGTNRTLTITADWIAEE